MYIFSLMSDNCERGDELRQASAKHSGYPAISLEGSNHHGYFCEIYTKMVLLTDNGSHASHKEGEEESIAFVNYL
jgi:hypothetical protein